MLASWHLFQRNGSLHRKERSKPPSSSLPTPTQANSTAFQARFQNGPIALKSDMQMTSREKNRGFIVPNRICDYKWMVKSFLRET